jgi:hypothetical protein
VLAPEARAFDFPTDEIRRFNSLTDGRVEDATKQVARYLGTDGGGRVEKDRQTRSRRAIIVQPGNHEAVLWKSIRFSGPNNLKYSQQLLGHAGVAKKRERHHKRIGGAG